MISAFLEISFPCGRTHAAIFPLTGTIFSYVFSLCSFSILETMPLASHCLSSSFIHHRCSCQILSIFIQQKFVHPSSECQALGWSLVPHSFCVIKNTFQCTGVFFSSSFKEIHDGMCVLGSRKVGPVASSLRKLHELENVII